MARAHAADRRDGLSHHRGRALPARRHPARTGISGARTYAPASARRHLPDRCHLHHPRGKIRAQLFENLNGQRRIVDFMESPQPDQLLEEHPRTAPRTAYRGVHTA